MQPLLDAIDAEHPAPDSEDWLKVAETSTVVHEAIVDVASSALLTSWKRAVSGSMTWLFYLTSARDQRQQSDEHHGLLEAIRAGNDHLAEAMPSHISRRAAPLPYA
ncbi:FCD domain-containing protein [Arthrobacter sp. M4]|uniref:FCD domain-containing protein n=1 Tax=Arthrobacter sp. M4 TaxID=218160 RepID=UPI001CDBB6A1|nr:FCD domain-containing protein [Arthrobacter sp. M4]MCA4134794.1 FCD domain-containing protein [Arthrobacter sp. M4]